MLLVGGEDALSGLQNITIVAALPFLVVMVGLAVALVKDLRDDPLIVRRAVCRRGRRAGRRRGRQRARRRLLAHGRRRPRPARVSARWSRPTRSRTASDVAAEDGLGGCGRRADREGRRVHAPLTVGSYASADLRTARPDAAWGWERRSAAERLVAVRLRTGNSTAVEAGGSGEVGEQVGADLCQDGIRLLERDVDDVVVLLRPPRWWRRASRRRRGSGRTTARPSSR